MSSNRIINKETLELIKEKTSIFPPESVYKESVVYLAEQGYFRVLDKTIHSSEHSFLHLHKTLVELGSSGYVGIGVAYMAQINVAGRILAETDSIYGKKILEELVTGKIIVSAGVSEKGWKGNLSNIQTILDEENLTISGEKSFITNGPISQYAVILTKGSKTHRLLCVLVSLSSEGVSIEPIETKFAKEATHCKIRFENVKIGLEEILDFSYKRNSIYIRVSELLSLASLFCGYGKHLLGYVNQELKQCDQLHEKEQDLLLDLRYILGLLETKIEKMSELKDQCLEEKVYRNFPFGTEAVARLFKKELETLLTSHTNAQLPPDFELFLLTDPMTEALRKKA
jgi:hypothetical protein